MLLRKLSSFTLLIKASGFAGSPFAKSDDHSLSDIPSSSKCIFLELETAITRKLIFRFSFKNFFCW